MSFRAQREILLFKISHIRSRWQGGCFIASSYTVIYVSWAVIPKVVRNLDLSHSFEMTGVFFVISSAARNLASTLVNEISLIILHIRSGQGSRWHVVSDCFGSVPLNDISMLSLRNFYHTFDKNCHYFGLWLWGKFKVLCFYNQLCFWTNSHFSGINIALFKINTWFVNVNLF